jgi:hypothetical protein
MSYGGGSTDLQQLLAMLERYLSSRENITLTMTAGLVQAVHGIVDGRKAADVTMAELIDGLRKQGLSSVPIGTVAQTVNLVSEIPSDQEVLSQVSLRQAHDQLVSQ